MDVSYGGLQSSRLFSLRALHRHLWLHSGLVALHFN